MRLIDEFIEKVLNTKSSFSINIYGEGYDTTNYHFIQSDVGKARYIYGMKNWNNDKFYSDIRYKPELVAIVVDDIIYVIDDYFLQTNSFFVSDTSPLPENVKDFDAVVKEKNAYASDVIFKKFYDSLETDIVTNERDLARCKENARKQLFSKESTALCEEEKLGWIFNKADIANIICGFLDMEKEVEKYLERNKDEWVYKKSLNEKMRSMMEDPETAFAWELEIAKGIRNVDAKTVVVEFELNGKIASAKMNPGRIISKLLERDCFSYYDFEVSKQGKQLLEDLEAGDYWHNPNNALRCQHITKITYKKKELYVRK